MKKVMLICSGGMSTSLLASKVKKLAEEKGLDLDIFAIAAQETDEELEKQKLDLILLGPQIAFMKKQIQGKVADTGIPIDSIDRISYGMMDAKKVLEQIQGYFK